MSKEPTRNEMELPSTWVRNINACIKRNQSEIDRYVRFCNWYRGNLTDLIDPDSTPNMDSAWQSSLDNMHTFVTDAAIAQMFFRNPRFSIRTPGMGWGIWTPGLARVEAAMLNDTIEQIGYFRRARRRLLDARNGPYGILKITYDCDMVVDMETIEAAREEAAAENQAFMLGRLKEMEATEKQIHSAHIDKHNELIAMAERGEVMIPKAALKYLKKHVKIHDAMRTSEMPTETARDAQIVVRRVSPLDWYYDVTVDDIADSRWFCHTYLMRKVDALANERFSKKARGDMSDSPDRWVRAGVMMPRGLPATGTFDNSDVMVRVYEVFDRCEGVIREFFEGGEEMADQRDFTLKSVQPSGPYSILMFKPDPLEATGISPPIAWAAEQHADVRLQSAIVSAAIEGSRARGVFDKSAIGPEKVEEIINGPAGTWFPVDLPPNKEIKDVMAAAPNVEITEQTLLVRSDVRGRISQSSGLGSQRTLSGDKSGSATEAAITSGAADAISEDQAAVLDDASAYDGKMIVRLTRKCMTKAQVVEVVGPEAEKFYPETWADRDIVNDRNVYTVPGSSRRRSTDVQSKVMTDFMFTGVAALPSMQLPEGQSLLLDAARRVADDMGFAGLDWDAVDNAQKAMAMMQQQMAMQGQGDGDGQDPESAGEDASESGPPKNRQRPAEQTEPSVAAQQQGMANVGGGRVATSASAGDQMRLLRAKGGM